MARSLIIIALLGSLAVASDLEERGGKEGRAGAEMTFTETMGHLVSGCRLQESVLPAHCQQDSPGYNMYDGCPFDNICHFGLDLLLSFCLWLFGFVFIPNFIYIY